MAADTKGLHGRLKKAVLGDVVCLSDGKRFRGFLEKVMNEAVDLEVGGSPAKIMD